MEICSGDLHQRSNLMHATVFERPVGQVVLGDDLDGHMLVLGLGQETHEGGDQDRVQHPGVDLDDDPLLPVSSSQSEPFDFTGLPDLLLEGDAAGRHRDLR
jgi:hypothetical protein